MRNRMQARNWFMYAGGTGRTRHQRVRFGGRVTAEPWERVVISRCGRTVGQVVGASRRVWRTGVTACTLDMRPWTVTVPAQEVPTSDGVTVKLTLAGQARIVDPDRFVSGHQDVDAALHLVAQLALRDVVAGSSIETLVSARAELGASLLAAVRGVDELGLVLDRLDVRDVMLPADVKRAQAQVLLARAEGLAALERARGESAALRALANAARLADEHPSLVSLRLLQQLGTSGGNTVVLGGTNLTR